MKQIRGKRVVLLIAGALPLLAEQEQQEPPTHTSSLPPQQQHGQQQQEHFIRLDDHQEDENDDSLVEETTKRRKSSITEEEEDDTKKPQQEGRRGGDDDEFAAPEEEEAVVENQEITGHDPISSISEQQGSLSTRSSPQQQQPHASLIGFSPSEEIMMTDYEGRLLFPFMVTPPFLLGLDHQYGYCEAAEVVVADSSSSNNDSNIDDWHQRVCQLSEEAAEYRNHTTVHHQSDKKEIMDTTTKNKEAAVSETKEDEETTANSNDSKAEADPALQQHVVTDDSSTSFGKTVDVKKAIDSDDEDSKAEDSTEPSTKAVPDGKDAASNESQKAVPDDANRPDENVKHVAAVDYASKSVGALILDSSHDFKGASNLLQKDRDRYAIVPCQEPTKYVVIGLSEDILVKRVILANYERYSSHMKEIRISGTATTDLGSTNNWVDLGTYVTTPPGGGGTQVFGLTNPTWARYLKFEFLSHYGDEHYCTVSQISVHGSTMLQGFHEQWAEEEEEELDDLETEVQKDKVDGDGDDPELDSVTNKLTLDAERTPSVGGDPDDIRADHDEKSGSRVLTKQSSIGKKMAEGAKFVNDSGSNGIAPLINACISEKNGICPWGFEHKMSLISAGNISDIDEVGALSSASICLSSSHPVTANKSFSAFNLSLGGRTTKALARMRRSSDRESSLVALSSAKYDKEANANSNSKLLVKTPSMIERIKELIRSTTVAISVDEIGDNSFPRKAPVALEADAISKSQPKQELSTDASRRDHTEVQVPAGSLDSKTLPNKPYEAEKAQTGSEAVKHAETKEGTLDTDSLHQSGIALAKLLREHPNSECLEKLNFVEFKASVSKNRAGNTGNAGGGATAEPIFKKLTDEIKALQANVAVHDAFAKESIACYQKVLVDVLLEMETLRSSQNARLSKLEHDLTLVSWIVAFQRALEILLQVLLSAIGGLFAAGVLLVDYVESSLLFAGIISVFLVMVAVRRIRATICNARKEEDEGDDSLPIETPEQKIQVVAPNAPPKVKTKQADDNKNDRAPTPDSTDQSDSTPSSRWKLKRFKKPRRAKNNTVSPE